MWCCVISKLRNDEVALIFRSQCACCVVWLYHWLPIIVRQVLMIIFVTLDCHLVPNVEILPAVSQWWLRSRSIDLRSESSSRLILMPLAIIWWFFQRTECYSNLVMIKNVLSTSHASDGCKCHRALMRKEVLWLHSFIDMFSNVNNAFSQDFFVNENTLMLYPATVTAVGWCDIHNPWWMP